MVIFVRSNLSQILRKITQTNQKEEAQNRDCYRYIYIYIYILIQTLNKNYSMLIGN